MRVAVLLAVAVLVPLVALVLEHAGNVRISERHHSHHDTYAVPASFTRALVLAMVFMAVLGLVMAWLSWEGALDASLELVLGFTDAFLVTCCALWAALCRYRVSTFDGCMAVTPLVGRRVWIRYAEIDHLEWAGLRNESGFRNLVVHVEGRRPVTLYGIVDIEQLIMSIDRFDLLPRSA
ncbi:hypothetical protein [Thermophilibacter sp.]